VCDTLECVRITELMIAYRAAGGIGVAQEQTSEIPAPGLGAARTIAERNDGHAHRGLGMASAHGLFGPRRCGAVRGASRSRIGGPRKCRRTVKPMREATARTSSTVAMTRAIVRTARPIFPSFGSGNGISFGNQIDPRTGMADGRTNTRRPAVLSSRLLTLASSENRRAHYAALNPEFFVSPRKHRVSQMIRGRPFQIINRRDEPRFQPAAFLHLRGRQPFAPTDRDAPRAGS
jgi:hypothetical protein